MIRFSSEWLSFFPHPAWTALAASNPRLFRSHQCGFDDIGYVKQSPEEAEVLFTLIAERYERRSMLITSNLGSATGSASSRTRWQPRPPSTVWSITR
jgi:hypothetical protein